MDYRKIAEDALRERASIFEQRKAVNEDGTLSDAEKRERFERMDADMDRLADEARAAVEAGEREAEVRSLTERAGALAGGTPERREVGGRDLNAEIRALIAGDMREVSLNPTDEPFRTVEQRAAVAGTATVTLGDAAWVGTTVDNTFVKVILQSLVEESDVLARVRKVSTSGGELMEWPRRTAKVTNVWQFIAENGTYAKSTNGGFERFPLNAYKFGALAEVTEEAATDSALNIAQIVAEDMGYDLARTLATKVWLGTGTNEPHGLITGATLTVDAATGSTTTATINDLIDLQHGIVAPYRRNSAFYMNDNSAKGVRKLQDANQNYVWQPAVVAGQPDRLLGSPVFTDYNLPDMAASATGAVVFGDVNRAYVLRTVRNIGVVRSTEYGFDRDTLTLKAKWRGDGGIADPTAYAVLVNSAT